MAFDGRIVTSIRLAAGSIEKIDQLAIATGRSRSQLLTEAVEWHVMHESWLTEQVEDALRDEEEHGHDPGYYMTTQEMVADFLARGILDAESWSEVQRDASA